MGSRSEFDSVEVHGGRNESTKRQNWWDCPKGDAHFDLFSTVSEIDSQNSIRVEQIKNARMYSNKDLLGGYPDLASGSNSVLPKNRPSYNLIKSAIDTLNSRIGKARPRPFFLTTNGDYQKQQKAIKLQQFMDGFFDKEQIYQKSKYIFRDACLFKLGVMKIVESENDLKIERVNPMEISVDEIDGRYGSPTCIYRTKFIKTTVLEAKYPKFKDKIKDSSIENPSTKINVCKVIEAIKKGKDGRRVIAIEDATLIDSPYTRDRFPYVFFKYEEEISGFYGEDLVDSLSPLQIEINKIMRMISKAIELVAVPKVFLTNTASIPNVQINNKIGQIIKHAAGQPPVFYTPTAMTPEVYKYLDWLIQKGYEIVGLSKMSATSEKPAGLSSGRALRTYQDIESDRFSIISQCWDNFFLNLCDSIVCEAKEFYKGKKINIVGQQFISTVPWAEIDINEDEYVTRVFSTNLLPTQPSAKLEYVRELVEMGAVKADRTFELMELPDTDKYIEQRNGTANLVKKQIDLILTKNQYQAPDPKINPTQGYEIANDRFLDLLSKEDVDQEKIELLSRYVEQIEELMAPPQQLEPISPEGGSIAQAQAPAGTPDLTALMGGMPNQMAPQDPMSAMAGNMPF